jgi:hypothetical protein
MNKMKVEKEIVDELSRLESKLQIELELYRSMNQIDMQSGCGNSALKAINKTKGQMKALKWVLNINE